MTTMIAPQAPASPKLGRPTILCSACGTAAVPSEPFCAHCGARVAIGASDARPADLAATRALQLSVVTVVANILVGGIAFAVLWLVSDATRLVQAALGLELIRFLVVVSVATLAVRLGVRGLRETADGRLRRRGWAIAGIVVASLWALMTAGSLSVVLAMNLH